MKPIYFSQSNSMSKSKQGNTPMPYWTDNKLCMSCWKPSFKERMLILFTGKVWLGVSGYSQPGVFISGKEVFANKKNTPIMKLKIVISNVIYNIKDFFSSRNYSNC